MIIEKNFENISAKKEKTMSEINIISQSRDVLMHLINSTVTQKRALKLKHYQLRVLHFIESNHAIDIHKMLQSEKKKLCSKCQESLKDGDLSCRPDLKQFILCDMLRQSIIVREAS